MEELRVPQRKVQVRVLLAGGTELDGLLFAPAQGPDGRPGRLIDRLNDTSEGFLPLVRGQEKWLLSKSWLVSITLEPGEDDREPIDGEDVQRVAIELFGGGHVEGELRYTMPATRARLLDYVNAAPRFVRLLRDDGLSVVNRDFIVRLQQI